jgi:hypothetical protein
MIMHKRINVRRYWFRFNQVKVKFKNRLSNLPTRNLHGTLIHPKRIYFSEHFCYCFSSNLCVLNTTNTDWRYFQQNCSGVSFCAEIQLSVKIREKSPKILFHQKTHGTRRRDGEEARGALTHRWRGPGHATLAWGGPSHPLGLPSRLHIPSDDLILGRQCFSQIDFRCAAAIRNRESEPETPFWHPAETGIWRRSSSPSSPTSLHRPSMTPPSMCE